MGNTISFKISEIAELLNKNILKIPPVQRGKVWNAVRVEVLWDSLLRGIPIGYLSVLPDSEKKYALLDGQQRCNAISMGYSDFNSESKAILWIDLGMNSAETEQDDNKIKHSNRRFFFRVSTQAHPWGYKLSDNETSNKTLNAYEKRYYERHKRSLIFFALKTKSGLPLDKNGFMLIQEHRSRILRFKNQEDKP